MLQVNISEKYTDKYNELDFTFDKLQEVVKDYFYDTFIEVANNSEVMLLGFDDLKIKKAISDLLKYMLSSLQITNIDRIIFLKLAYQSFMELIKVIEDCIDNENIKGIDYNKEIVRGYEIMVRIRRE